jgi:bifunctional non-homologous end joining protein LigD
VVVRKTARPRVVSHDPPRSGGGADVVVRGVRVSNAGRVMYERPRLTKLDLVRYYDRVALPMLPHVDGRPLTLVRCGQGVPAGCIYMKHSKVWAPSQLTRVKIREKTKIGDYLVIESPEAIVALAQMDIVEIHTWNTCKNRIEYPDRVVLDLDPGQEVTWDTMVIAARLLREMLHTLDLDSFLKTTGGKGLHVVVPLEPRADWEACLAFARAIAGALTRHDPALFTTTFGKRGRERQILVDYLRNNRTNTSVAAFSLRAREGAPVSLPISWSELTARLRPSDLTIATVPRRLERQRKDPWADYFRTRQRFSKKAIAALEGI